MTRMGKQAVLGPRQWQALSDAIYEMNTVRDHADFLSAVAAGLLRLIPSDYCLLHLLDRAQKRVLHHIAPENPFTDAEMAHYAEHPDGFALVTYYETTKDTRARRLSDVTDMALFRRSDHYRVCLSRLGLVYHLALPIEVNDTTVAGVTLSRRTLNFTVGHRALLDAFAPHILLAWKAHPNPWTVAADPKPPLRHRLQGLGLTVRESDVLFWMIEGKQNPEIAAILGRSLHTVQEHVANIIAKLGQENRHAVTVFALRSVLPS